MTVRNLHLVRPLPREALVRDATPGRPDALVAFIFVLHAILFVTLAAGGVSGGGALGYATVVVLVSGRELVHELRACHRAASRSSR